MVGVIEQHDRARFDVIAYDFSPPANDDYRGRFEAAFDLMFRSAGCRIRRPQERIARDESMS
jgi:predicted O-linked N-acetylglucosamine transferase (SPINDLY family)